MPQIRVLTNGGLWYLENEGKIKIADVYNFLREAGNTDPLQAVSNMTAKPNEWFEINIPDLSPIDKVIKNNFRSPDDCRIDFWRQMQKYIKEGCVGFAVNRLFSHLSDDDFQEQQDIVLREINYWHNKEVIR